MPVLAPRVLKSLQTGISAVIFTRFRKPGCYFETTTAKVFRRIFKSKAIDQFSI